MAEANSGTYITVNDLQAWCERTKLTITTIDSELEETAMDMIRGSLARSFDVTTWVSKATTPNMIQKVIALFIAGWTYNRQYSEDTSAPGSYGDRLIEMANKLLEGLAGGVIDLLDSDNLLIDNTSTSRPAFWPTDAATTLAVTYPEDANAAPRVFSMGKVF